MSCPITLPECAEDITPTWLKSMLSGEFKEIKAIDIKERKGEQQGYLGELISLTVLHGDSVTTHVVIKVKSHSKPSYELLEDLQFHSREGFFYKVLLPQFAAVANGDLINQTCAKCYLSLYEPEENCSAILLEDLEVTGYSLADFSSGLTLQQALDAVAALARYHAASYLATTADHDTALTPPQRVECKRFLNWKQAHSDMANWEYFFSAAREWFEDYYPGEIKLRKKIVSVMASAPEMFQNSGIVPEKCPRVVYHGDFWCNNIFFKPAAVEGASSQRDVRLIDFQCVAYGSAGIDLATFIMSSLNAEVRRASTDDILKHYHKAFLAAVSQGGDHTLAESYTLDTLMRSYDAARVSGLCWCLLSVVIFMDNGVSERLFHVIKDLADVI